jgi:[acyl-carrier-protein] S-malonyltransferase
MAPAQPGLRAALDAAAMNDPAFPVVANATAEPVGDAKTAKDQLAAQLVSPVLWTDCTKRLAEIGGAGAEFVEIGPGAVLAGLTKRIVAGASVRSIGTATEVRGFLEAA